MSVARARSLRRRSPLNERKLWYHLRDRSLTLHGYRVVRFKNALVEGWIDRVLDLIRIEISMAPITSGPLQDQGDQPRLNWSPGPAS